MSVWTLLARSCRLRCPRCGVGRLFTGWFRMPEKCERCGMIYQRAPGYFLGSIYFNYGVTALLVVVIYFTVYFLELLPSKQLLWVLAAFSVLFPLWFFRYARGLWIGFDQYFDPLPEDEEHDASESKRTKDVDALNKTL